MEFNAYVRLPFEVEAVEITEDNIEELAQFIGELKEKEDGTPYIAVDRKLIPNVYRVFPGFWLTRMGKKHRCYAPKIFKEQFKEKEGRWGEYFFFVDAPVLEWLEPEGIPAVD